MAPKNEDLNSKKRKRVAENPKKDHSKKTKPSVVKPKPKTFKKKSDFPAKDTSQLSKKEARQVSKERAEARKKQRKPHYDLEQELALLWEKMRRRNNTKEERSKFVAEALQKMKGNIPKIATSHVSSRVLQTCVKYCSDAERDAVYEELQPHLLTLASSTYGVHLVTKMFDNASKSQLPGLISLLHGHVAPLLRHSVGSIVIEHAYQKGNANQKRGLLMELYSTELRLFKDLANITETRVVDIIAKLGLQKSFVIRHMHSVLKPILEKGIGDHSIIHKALFEYLSIADKSKAAEVVEELSGSVFTRMIHTTDGSRVGMLCVKHGSAKQRKKIVKGMKGHIHKIALDNRGSLVLVSILSTVDDTKIVTNGIVRELQPILKELALDKSGRRPLLQLLHPYCQRYLSPDDLASLNASIPSLCSKDGEANQSDDGLHDTTNHDQGNKEEAEDDEADKDVEPSGEDQPVQGGKKDPFVRRQELLVKSGLAESLVDVCTENAEELLKSNFGKEVLYEVARGGVDGILLPTLDGKLTSLYKAIANLAAQPKLDESEHILENFHSSRAIRKLILDCPAFASLLWERALKGKSKMWAECYSSKVVSAYVESSDPNVRNLANKELQPLIDGGVLKISEAKVSSG